MLRGSLLRLGWASCIAFGLDAEAQPKAPPHGQLTVVTYNVAGLPEGLSEANPVANLPIIGNLLNKFDVALVQEDFAYPELLRQRLRLAYRSAPFVRGEAMHFGDGLSLFSKLPLGAVVRAPWSSCHGVVDAYFDCLTPKGLAYSTLQVGQRATVDVYDVHLDAGRSPEDVAARGAQLWQLVSTIKRVDSERALLLGGDFNLTAEELPQFRAVMREVGLADACDELRCPDASRIDRVLYRSGAGLTIKPRAWRLGTGFTDARGRALSDHEPVVVAFAWSAK